MDRSAGSPPKPGSNAIPTALPLQLIGAHIDITDLAIAKETLRESEERFRLIANSAPVPMWVTKIDRTRAFANQAYLEFLGVPYEEGLAFDWRKILHPDDVQRIVKESIAGEATLKPFVLEGRYRRADGRMALDAVGIAAALGSNRKTYRLHRRRPRRDGRQGSRIRASTT